MSYLLDVNVLIALIDPVHVGQLTTFDRKLSAVAVRGINSGTLLLKVGQFCIMSP